MTDIPALMGSWQVSWRYQKSNSCVKQALPLALYNIFMMDEKLKYFGIRFRYVKFT